MEIVLVSRWERNREKVKREGVSAYLVSSKYIDYNVMSRNFDYNVMSMWQAKRGKRKWQGKNSQKYGATEWRNVFFIRFLFWYYFRVVWYSPCIVRSDKILDVVLNGLFWKWPQILIVCGIFCNVYVSLVWLGNNRMFTKGPGDRGSIPGRVIPKTKKNGTWCLLASHSAL